MPYIAYLDKRFRDDSLDIIDRANSICEQYAGHGITLTLRQIYYQFVARDWLPNEQRAYKRLGSILSDARMTGMMDWDHMQDRTRNLVSRPEWLSPAHLIRSAAAQYRIDLWSGQDQRVEVWIEKDAGIGVIEGVCQDNAVPYFSCRGYTSMSELWEAGQRIVGHLGNRENVTILHVGDHDPSGLDMTRDMEARLDTFISNEVGWDPYEVEWEMRRIALNPDQIETYQPPPNPAKQTDARFQRYVAETGFTDSWELDALDPLVLQGIIQEYIDGLRDIDLWNERVELLDNQRSALLAISERWPEVEEWASDGAGE